MISLRHVLRILRANFDISASVMLIYRGNVIFFLIFETLFTVARFVVMGAGFNLSGGAIRGWTLDEALLLTAVNGLSHQLFVCFFIGPLFEVPTKTWNGMYDYIVLKPINLMLSIFAAGQVIVSNLPSLVLNFALVLVFLARSNVALGFWDLLAMATLTGLGLAVRVALALACIAPAFISERLADTEHAFWELAHLSSFPPAVFPRWLDFFLSYVLPLGMVAAFPVGFVFGKQPVAVTLISIACTLGFVTASVVAFGLASRSYKSVNSGV